MSFSSDVKDELSKVPLGPMHCICAELAAMITFGGRILKENGQNYIIELHSENDSLSKRFCSLVNQMGCCPQMLSHQHGFVISDQAQVRKLLKHCGFQDNLGRIVEEEGIFDSAFLHRNCCQRSFLRGAFLASGSITDPEKNYHFEITCLSESIASRMQELFAFFELEAKIILRKKYYVIYMKEGAMISDMLAIMEAHISKMNFENVRIIKDVRNVVNRRVNCETANINKTVSAARKQIEDIEYVKKTVGLDKLPDSLRELAYARLEEPEATLKELGESLNPPVGKSGVNHRLRKINQMAQDIRDNNIV